MKFDYFLKLNDNAVTYPSDIGKRLKTLTSLRHLAFHLINRKKVDDKSLKKLAMHKFKIVSPSAQRVWITFTTWDSPAIPKSCNGGYSDKDRHYLWTPERLWYVLEP